MKMMEGMRRVAPAATVTLAAGLALAGCSSAEESVPEEIAVAWEDAEGQLVTGGEPTPLQIYEAADIDEKEISVDTAGLDYGERAAAIANAVFKETGSDVFQVTSEGMTDGEYMASLEIGRSWPWDGTFTTRQLESASEVMCTTGLANGIDIVPDDPITAALAGEQEGDTTNAVVFACIGRLAAEVALIDSGTVELIVPIGQR